MGIRLLVDIIGKESILLKPAALSFCVFRFLFDSSFGQAGRVKKRAIFCINLSREQDVCQVNCTYGCYTFPEAIFSSQRQDIGVA